MNLQKQIDLIIKEMGSVKRLGENVVKQMSELPKSELSEYGPHEEGILWKMERDIEAAQMLSAHSEKMINNIVKEVSLDIYSRQTYWAKHPLREVRFR